MAQPGQHILLVDQHTAFQDVIEAIMLHMGRRVTLATNYDEAVAVLRSTLHPLIVHTGTGVMIPGKGSGSMLLELLSNPDFAATHAFVVSSALEGDQLAAMRERIAQTGAAYVGWVRLPTQIPQLIAAQEAAEAWLTARR